METQQLRVTSMSTACLILYVDSARNLPVIMQLECFYYYIDDRDESQWEKLLQCLRGGSKQPDVFLEASVGAKTERTRTMLRSCDPIWEQGFTFLVGNPETSSLNVKVNMGYR